MDQSRLDPTVRRPRGRRVAGLFCLALIVVVASGCAGRRRSMRPVFLSPAPVSAGCPTTISPVDEPALSAPGAPSTPTIEPGLEPASLPSEAPLTSTPGPSVPRIDTPPPVTGPSASPGAADEPGLEPIDSGTSGRSSSAKPVAPSGGTGSGSSGVPKAAPGPGTSLKTDPYGTTPTRRRVAPAPTPGRVRQASALRDEVRPYVNDPDDLFAPPKADRPWKYIVLHHSANAAGGYNSIDQEHRKRLGWNGCGYHFVIGNGSETADGTIEVSQRWINQKLGVHCRDGKHPDVNEYGIGICLVGDLENAPPTPKQVAAARALVAYLSDRYKIPVDHTETHDQVAVGPTSCPGRHFPKQAILNPSGLAFHLDD